MLIALTAVAPHAHSFAALPSDALSTVALVPSLPLQVLTISSATGITVDAADNKQADVKVLT
jgi:hypothetical protein